MTIVTVRTAARALGTVAIAMALATGGPAEATTPPPSTVPAPTTTSTVVAATTTTTAVALAPDATGEDLVRRAKVGWARFVSDYFATPTSIAAPCPLSTPEALTADIAALGLVPSALAFGTSLYWDATGAGIVGIACGVDLSKSADPSGSTGYVVEATLLDGQAVFPQYVVRLAGNNTPITPSADLGGETIVRCLSGSQVCVASWHRDGLVVTVRLRGSRTDDSEAQAGFLLTATVPDVVASLAA